MKQPDKSDVEPRLFFTEPWDPIVTRRGDPLGLRALSDEFADVVAPGLSNRIRDGRWVTILAWSLLRSHQVFRAMGEQSVDSREQQRQRYAWLQPLELMWVARTLKSGVDLRGRSLAGQRAVKRWLDHRGHGTRFGMSAEQSRAYRQTGMYGGFRLGFRRWPGLTRAGDGWTPDDATFRLARWLDKNMGSTRPEWSCDAESETPRRVSLSKGSEDKWWIKHWPEFFKMVRGADVRTLPRPRDEFCRLPEASLLKPVLFFESDKDGSRRLKVALKSGKCTGGTHLDLCKHLSSEFSDDPVFHALPHFSRLADAGVEAMAFIAAMISNGPTMGLTSIANNPAAPRVCKELYAAARVWEKTKRPPLRHIDTADRLSEAIRSPKPTECLTALLHHHETHGGGLRWFVLRGKPCAVEPRTPPRRVSSRYRFRLWPLCRLAVQCGVLTKMPSALLSSREMDEDTQEDSDE